MSGDGLNYKVLKTLREALGLSQEAVAKRAGMRAENLSTLENGKRKNPTINSIIRVSRAMNVSPKAVIMEMFETADEGDST